MLYMGVSYLTAAALFTVGTFIFPFCFMLQSLWWKKTSWGLATAKKYGLSDKDMVDISNKIVSSLQAVCAGVSGLILYFNCQHDVLHAKDPMSVLYAWFGIPYFIYDTFCMFYVYTYTLTPKQSRDSTLKNLYHFILKSPVIFIHHMIMAPVGWTLIMFYRDEVESGDFFVGIIYMMELSTPFVSLRFILSKLKMKSSALYALNGVLMLITFPIFRILSVLYGAYLFSSQNNFPSIFHAIWTVPLHWKLIWVSAVAPQIYWFFLMYRGLIKIFFPPPLHEITSKKD